MKAIGEFVFKGLESRDGGEFVNDKGQSVKYGASTILKVDELNEGSINERKLKIPNTSVSLIETLKKIKPYDKINIECDVLLYNNSAKVVPVAIVGSKQ